MKKNLPIFLFILSTFFSLQGAKGQGNTPCTATALTVGATCSYTAGTTVGATYQTNANNFGIPSCASPGAPDVWYTFVAPASGSVTIDTDDNGITDSGMQLYSATACSGGTYTSIDCDDDDSANGAMSLITASGLTPGQTYYIRFWEYSTGTGTFSICVKENAVATNDNCASPTVVTQEPFGTCTATSGTVSGATQSQAGCAGTADDDVWYSFVATSTTAIISRDANFDSVLELFNSCGGTSLGCFDSESDQTFTGLTIGNTYRYRIYSWSSSAPADPTFTTCVTTPPPPPANDNCANAVSLTMGESCTSTNGYVTGGTQSQAGCVGTANDDVWYSFVATNDTAIVNRDANFDSVIQIFSSCGGTSLNCSDSENDVTLTGLTVGNTYFIRVYSYSSTSPADGTFDICVISPPPSFSNTTCAQMNPICTSSSVSFTASNGGTSESGNNYGCLTTQPNPTWFYFEIATSGNLIFDLSASDDVDFAIWGPYANLAAAQANCGSLPAPIDCSYSSSEIEQAVLNGVVAGEVYIFLVTNFADIIQVINMQTAGSNTAQTNCDILTPVTCEADAGSW